MPIAEETHANEPKFTPGPWFRSSKTVYALMHDGWRKGIEQFRNRFYCSVQADRSCSVMEEQANAHLIAAAPDPYESLENALCYVAAPYEFAFPDEGANKRLLRDIEATLAKARGEALETPDAKA